MYLLILKYRFTNYPFIINFADVPNFKSQISILKMIKDGASQSNQCSNFEINNLFVQTEESFNSKIGHL